MRAGEASSLEREGNMSYIREPAVSGAFYPDDPGVLRREVEEYIENADVSAVSGDVVGIVAPHAGYMYSGQVAAYGYKTVMGCRYDTVVIIAPSHRGYFEYTAVLGSGAYRTPLGPVAIDEETAGELVALQDGVQSNVEAHRGEHSLEVQLPFLQVVLADFKIVPLIMGAQSPDLCERLAAGLYKVMNRSRKKFLVVGSTDLSHYYPYKEALHLDGVVRKDLEGYDVEGLLRDLDMRKCEACGAGPIISTMLVCRRLGAGASKVLRYANSGDVSGDKSGVVGYISCIFYREIKVG